MTPTLPDSSMFDIPDSYKKTYSDELYLASDILIRRRERMLIFCTKAQLELLFDSPLVMMDGTFSATPPFFDQIYTIHAVKFNASNKHVPISLPYILFYCRFSMCIQSIAQPQKIYLS